MRASSAIRRAERFEAAFRARLGTLLLGLALAAGPAEALNFVVNSTLDTPDAALNGVCLTAGGVCTLRAAIQESNFGGAANTITFNLGAGPYSIAVGAAGLPIITRAVTIDGYSQAGSSANTLAVGTNAVLLIELNGTATGAGVDGLTIAAPTTVRGLVINRFAGSGIQVNVGGGASLIAGNYVGTNAAGTAGLANNRDTAGSEAGIVLFAGGVTIGGTAPADRNVVSGHNLGGSRGIEFWDSSGNTIQGNHVGTNAAGTAGLGNGGAGIAFDGTAGVGSDNNLIGGTIAGAGNLVSGGLAEGIAVYTSSTGNAILGNRIYGNGGLGIDLGGNGVTGNDPLDGDGGPNNQLNFPVISGVSVVGTWLVVSFSLDVPAGSYRVEFFRNPSGVDPSGNGEGEVFAGFANVSHPGGGSRSFSATINGAAGDRITATTTLCSDGATCSTFSDTSEFSANLIATPINYRSIGAAPNSSAGSLNTTNNSLSVTGVGTAWRTINRGRGDVISICDQAFPTCTTSTNYTVLAVNSDNQLTLTTPYTGTTGSHGYTIRRQFTTLTDWEACIDGQGGSPPPAAPCFWFPAPTASLVADNRSEVGIAYNDTAGADFVGPLVIDNSVTDATHTITLTADGTNRHYGIPGQGVLINSGGGVPAVQVFDDFVTVEWMEIAGAGGTDGFRVNLLSAGTGSLVTLRNNLVHNVAGDGIALYDDDGRVDVYNNISYGNNAGLWINPGALLAASRIQILNNTFYGNQGGVFKAAGVSAARVLLRNNISVNNNPSADYSCDPLDSVTANSGNNLDEDGSGGAGAGTHNPAGGNVTSTVAGVAFVNAGAGDLHILPSSTAKDVGGDLSSVFTTDIDAVPRSAPWDIGADETGAIALYRSVGITATALATGAANALTIAGSTATFASPLPANVGVGDVIQYDSDNNGSIDALAFIHGRNSGQSFTVKNKNGVAATATAAADLDWSVFRAYTGLANWENGIENPNILEPVENDVNPATNLVTANTVMHVACYADGADVGSTYIDSWDTGPNNYIRIYTPFLSNEVGTSQRHNGVWSTSAYRLLQDASYFASLGIRERYVRVDGLQLEANQVVATESNGIHIGDDNADLPVEFHISNNIIRSITAATPLVAFGIGALNNFGDITLDNTLYVARIWNNIVYGFVGTNSSTGIYAQNYGTVYAYNNTFVGAGATHRGFARFHNVDYHAKNNISINSVTPYQGVFNAASTNNFSDLGGAPGLNPKTRDGAGADPIFVGGADYHLHPTDTWARDQGANLSGDANLPIFDDIDRQSRVPLWDIGADDASGTTAVKLLAFTALPLDSAISLSWQTGSELDNLGFHVYRAQSENGPWSRLTASLIPGLGSSAVGRAYSFRDGGLTNGARYFYRLEDVDAASKTTSHGPVSAVPQPAAPGSEGRSGGSGGSDQEKGSSSSCPDWVLQSYASSAGADIATASLRCTRHGDPEATSLEVLSRDSRQATLELRTSGFYALHTPSRAGEPAGTVRVFVPGFDFPQDEQAAALPIRRALVEAVVGRRVQLGGVRALDLVRFRGLVPSALGKAEMQVGWDGTVRAARRGLRSESVRVQGRARGARALANSDLVKLLPSVFQGETKSAVLELSPLRFEAQRQQLVLAKRLRVRLLFSGRELAESGRGSLGRAPRLRKPVVSGERLARLYSTSQGLHAVSFEQLFPGRARGFAAPELRLERQGEPVAFHLEPAASSFGPGSRLYFYAERTALSTDFSSELAWELLHARDGPAMPLRSAAPGSSPVATASLVTRSFETNRFYQPGLLEAADPWLWEALASGATRVRSFALSGVVASGTAELGVFLHGASESGQAVDHQLSVSVNGTLVGEAQFAGKTPYRMSLSLPAALLREGANELQLTNVGDTGVSSLVFLDRFTLAHPQTSWLAGGRFEGTWLESGSVSLSGVTGVPVVVDVTGASGPRWLTDSSTSGGELRFSVEAGRRYLVASPEALLVPRVAAVEPSTLRSSGNQADYLLIAPRAFLGAAEPLLRRRADQGLTARAVAFEEIVSEFGYGEPSAEAIRSFLAYAFHSWARPSPRYAVLLGDSSYDPRKFISTSQPAPLPALWAKTSYLWTVSDPQLAAVNGEDPLPDLAIGRLPATTVEQAQSLVAKLLAWEDSGQALSGPAALVADNPDIAGDFEADVRDIAQSYLAGRSPQLLLMKELGPEMRPRILDALNSGLSYLSYVGHGGAAVWASENVWNSWDAASLQAQSIQPLLITMNCLNGYFVAPAFESLSESLLKAEGRGAIAAFSPSGLSLDGPAHQYHRALMAELTSGRHERLGDALAAAQQAYAHGGLMPELLSIYHLLGDPATRIR